MPPNFPIVPYPSPPRRLLTRGRALAAGAAALTLLLLFAAGIRAHNAHRDRSASFAYAEHPGNRQAAEARAPSATPAPTPGPDCLSAVELAALIDRPVRLQTADGFRRPPGPAPAGSGCLQQYAGPVATVETVETAQCIVMHQATPAQLCVVEGGYQYYFIGADQTGAGPYLATVDTLSGLHPTGSGPVELYRGQNPLTAKQVVIQYQPDREELRINTYYADTATSTNKPYVFTVDGEHRVSHLSW